jgi:DNA-binding MarR family transcriptional regulator/N-acetylglutamate synthase-like GNAT family acetyltransferase
MTLADDVTAIRRFNRFWTAKVGLLDAGLLDTPYSLTEARVVFELAQRPSVELADLRRVLDLDSGYLSRIVRRFQADGIVEAVQSSHDGRRRTLSLTPRGREVFADLNARSTNQTAALLASLTEEDRSRVVNAMATIADAFAETANSRPYLLRPLYPGDLGWVVYRHGVLYADEYGWDESFEALVARLVADYAEPSQTTGQSAWIAELDGEPVGCVFCMHRDDNTAQLRLLLVEPKARGLGIGRRLVDECVRFARRSGYQSIRLWTNDVLTSARRIYEAAGFRLVDEEPHHSFGHDLVGQTWELRLEVARPRPGQPESEDGSDEPLG